MRAIRKRVLKLLALRRWEGRLTAGSLTGEKSSLELAMSSGVALPPPASLTPVVGVPLHAGAAPMDSRTGLKNVKPLKSPKKVPGGRSYPWYAAVGVGARVATASGMGVAPKGTPAGPAKVTTSTINTAIAATPPRTARTIVFLSTLSHMARGSRQPATLAG